MNRVLKIEFCDGRNDRQTPMSDRIVQINSFCHMVISFEGDLIQSARTGVELMLRQLVSEFQTYMRDQEYESARRCRRDLRKRWTSLQGGDEEEDDQQLNKLHRVLYNYAVCYMFGDNSGVTTTSDRVVAAIAKEMASLEATQKLMALEDDDWFSEVLEITGAQAVFDTKIPRVRLEG